MITFLAALGVTLAVLATIGLFLASLLLCADKRRYGPGAACGAAGVLAVALLVTWAVKADDDRSGLCGAGTTRVGYPHGKSTSYVCERTPQ